MDFWRSEAYSKYFDYLDATGGFYYERWGDAPVHSLGITLFADKNQIHFFDDIGYEHNPYTHCPRGAGKWEKGKCACNPDRSFGTFCSTVTCLCYSLTTPQTMMDIRV